MMKQHNWLRKGIVWSVILMLLTACEADYTPKPRGYFRIDLPRQNYLPYEKANHYLFEYSSKAIVEPKTGEGSQDDWYTIHYPDFKADIYLSYKQINSDLPVFLEDARTMALKHLPKASSIADSLILMPGSKVYGMVYYINGKGVASPMQFYLTDSTNHFVRGALYFNFRPENDSVAPVIQHIKSDILHLVGSLRWK